MRSVFWSFYVDLYDNVKYYEYYRSCDRVIDAIISGFLVLTSLGCVAAWSIWKTVPILWSIVIVSAQVVSGLKFLMPYTKRISAIGYMLPDLRALLSRVQKCWEQDVENKKLPDDKISNLKYKFCTEMDGIIDKYAGGPEFAVNKWALKKAEEDRIAYVKATYGVDTPPEFGGKREAI